MSKTPWDKDYTLRKGHFTASGLEKLGGADMALDLGTSQDVKKHYLTGAHLKNLTFLRHGLEKTVTDDMALDRQISQGVNSRFEPKLEISRTLSFPTDLGKIGESLETP